MQQEEDEKGHRGENRSINLSSSSPRRSDDLDASRISYDDTEDDELIDMEMDDDECHSDDGNQLYRTQ